MNIIYTKTDEAPALATQSLLPIIKSFVKSAHIEIQLKDISLAGRIIAHFPEYLSKDQQQPDDLKELGEWIQTPYANIIKLPNISASLPQLKSAISELQSHGYPLPDFPDPPKDDREREIRRKYAKILGSAVNPVLREGNSDRRVAWAVKQYARKNPHSMGAWSPYSRSHVAYMEDGDFYSTEKSVLIDQQTTVEIEFLHHNSSNKEVLKKGIEVLKNEIIDASVMSHQKLSKFFKEQIKEAKKEDILWSVHLKATMMKVSDPIIFGEAMKAFFGDVFDKYALTFKELGVNPKSGLEDLCSKIQTLPKELTQEIEAALRDSYRKGPGLAMVDSDKGITNLHIPNNVIIDASMPAMIRASGKMWGSDGKLHDVKAVIPDKTYARVYEEVIKFCKKYGAFDVSTMGNVSNIGLMAKKAEEYGSHDKTFQVTQPGVIRVTDVSGKHLMEHVVEVGDIWRMCQTKDIAVRDWVKLGVHQARTRNLPAVFWLDPHRPHDAQLITKIKSYLKRHDTHGVEIKIMSLVEATNYTLKRVKEGRNTISVTGNVLRDYLTDLFPILELGTSSKMLSTVPLLAGGSLFETGAGGSAPKHVEQFLAENHLRWDSLGEYLALCASLEDLGEKQKNSQVSLLAETLDRANAQILEVGCSPSRKVGELDTRGSHFFFAMYWAEALSQTKDSEFKRQFSKLASELKSHAAQILKELHSIQGQRVDIGGYFHPHPEKLSARMRPSPTFNQIIDSI